MDEIRPTKLELRKPTIKQVLKHKVYRLLSGKVLTRRDMLMPLVQPVQPVSRLIQCLATDYNSRLIKAPN